jgi:hypothetical protein
MLISILRIHGGLLLLLELDHRLGLLLHHVADHFFNVIQFVRILFCLFSTKEGIPAEAF